MDRKDKDKDFIGVIKLVSGEEILSKICPCEEENKTILILDTPVTFETVQIRQAGMGAVRVHPWLDMSTDPILVIDMDKVITVTEVSDKQIIKIYERYIKDKDRETNESPANEDMGFLSSISDARIFLEKLYKSS